MCDGANLLTCDGQGNITSTMPCALGCQAAEQRCRKVDPSNGLAGALDDAAGATELVLSGTTTIDTDAGTIVDATGARSPLTQTLTAGLPVALFVIKARSITAGPINVVGTRALALVADGTITFNGTVSVDAARDVPGPGAITNQVACQGGAGGAGTTDGYPGGGGGGFGTAGGQGGAAVGQLGGTGGSVVGNVELVPLRGGCSGGGGKAGTLDADPALSDPGGGGGALQVVSNTSIVVGSSAFLSANGAGGKGYTGSMNIFCSTTAPCGIGEGAGSGGAILLEAPTIAFDATAGVVANGGAGSCATTGSAPAGGLNNTPAPGPVCGGDTGKGGNGGAGSTAATNGGDGINDDPVGGGGGGGTGRIRVNLPSGVQFQTTAVVSPPASVGVLGTR